MCNGKIIFNKKIIISKITHFRKPIIRYSKILRKIQKCNNIENVLFKITKLLFFLYWAYLVIVQVKTIEIYSHV